MSWYTQGTVSIANGATAVTGTLTGWTSQTLPEDAITFDGGSTWYEIAAVGGNTAITLASPYLGTPIVNGAYKIQRLGRGHGQVSYLAQQVAALLTQFPAFAGIADAGNTWRIKSDGSGWEMCTPAQLLGRHIFTGFSGASGMATATGLLGEVEVRNSSGGGAFMSFHRVGVQGAYFGVDTDNIWKVGGWTYGAVAYRVVHEGLSGITIPGQIRANVTAGTAWALAGSSATVAIANNATYQLAVGSGLIGLSDNLGAVSGVVFIMFGAATIIADPQSKLSATASAASKLSVYYSAGPDRYILENKTGATVNLFITPILVRTSN